MEQPSEDPAVDEASPSRSVHKSPGVSPYLNGNSGKASPKSKHMATIKSLGLLHDLQTYVRDVESIALEQKKELERVRQEKRDVEKTVYKLEVQGDKGVYWDFFHNAELSELPPKLRAVFEENKVLKEKLRKYKQRAEAFEAEATRRNNQVLVLEDTVSVLKQQLQACSRQPADVEREEGLKSQIEDMDRKMKTQHHDLRVLMAKIETDAKLQRHERAAAAKEKEALKRQLIMSHAEQNEKDKELRAVQLEMKQLRRKLAPTRGSQMAAGDMPVDMSPPHSANRWGATTPSGSATVEEPAVHLMLCIVREPVEVLVPVPMAAESGSMTPPYEEPAPAADVHDTVFLTQAEPGMEEEAGREQAEQPLDPEPQPQQEEEVQQQQEQAEAHGEPEAEVQREARPSGEEAEGHAGSEAGSVAGSRRSRASGSQVSESFSAQPKPVPFARTAARLEKKASRNVGGGGSITGSQPGGASGASSQRGRGSATGGGSIGRGSTGLSAEALAAIASAQEAQQQQEQQQPEDGGVQYGGQQQQEDEGGQRQPQEGEGQPQGQQQEEQLQQQQQSEEEQQQQQQVLQQAEEELQEGEQEQQQQGMDGEDLQQQHQPEGQDEEAEPQQQEAEGGQQEQAEVQQQEEGVGQQQEEEAEGGQQEEAVGQQQEEAEVPQQVQAEGQQQQQQEDEAAASYAHAGGDEAEAEAQQGAEAAVEEAGPAPGEENPSDTVDTAADEPAAAAGDGDGAQAQEDAAGSDGAVNEGAGAGPAEGEAAGPVDDTAGYATTQAEEGAADGLADEPADAEAEAVAADEAPEDADEAAAAQVQGDGPPEPLSKQPSEVAEDELAPAPAAADA